MAGPSYERYKLKFCQDWTLLTLKNKGRGGGGHSVADLNLQMHETPTLEHVNVRAWPPGLTPFLYPKMEWKTKTSIHVVSILLDQHRQI